MVPKALAEPGSEHGDYYIFRDEPNNWTSVFGGSAWKYCGTETICIAPLLQETERSELGDLNCREIIAAIRWWLEESTAPGCD